MSPSSRQPWSPPSPTQPPHELGGYRLVELIARGGMGEVWRGEREGAGGIRRRAAIKRILPRLANDPQLRARFLAEARTHARLEHPNVVRMLDYGEQPELFLVFEYVEGTSAAQLLAELVRGGHKLPVVAAAFVCAEVAAGLHYAHRKRDDDGTPLGIVHRDVSPQNVLLSLDGAVKVSDFGIARAADRDFRTREGVSIGKVAYMAPEQAAGRAVDARADVFSLGVVLWELLTVSPLLPRDRPDAALEVLLRGGPLRTPSEVDPQLPASIDRVVMPALAFDPAKRYPSAGAFAEALRALVHEIRPGFDSGELARLLGRMVPAVAFTSTSTPPPPMGVDLAVPREVRAPAPPASRPVVAPSALPVMRHPAPRGADRLVSGSRLAWVVLAAAVLTSAAGAAGFAIHRRNRSHARAHAASAQPAVPDLAPAQPPPATSIAGFGPAPMAKGPAANGPLAASAPSSAQSPSPTPPAPPMPRPRSAPSPGGADARSRDALRRQLAALEPAIRVCFGLSVGSRARVTVDGLFEPATGRATEVTFRASGPPLDSGREGCAREAVRAGTRGVGLSAPTHVTYAFRF